VRKLRLWWPAAASSSANWHLAVWMNRRLQNRVLIFANVGGLAIVQ
jgi:hypothetical protein